MSKVDAKLTLILTHHLLGDIDTLEAINKIKDTLGYIELAPIENRLEVFRKSVWAWHYKSKQKYDSSIVSAFIEYWSGLADNKLMKFEIEDTFKIGGRLATFAKNTTKFQNNKTINNLKNLLSTVNPLR